MKNCVVEHSFLFWKWKTVEHSYKMKSIGKFMNCSETFEVTYKCQCGAKYVKHFVTQDELLKLGITMDILNTINQYKHHRL